MSSHETQLGTLKWHQQCHANIWHLVFFQNTSAYDWFEREFPLCSASGLGRNARQGEEELLGALDGGGWVSGMW